MTRSLVSLMVEVEPIGSFADDEHDANVSDVSWRETKRGGVSDDANDGKMTTNVFDLFHR